MRYYGFPKYVSVAEKKAMAEKKLTQLKKKNPGMKPVIVQGSALARTWWGKEWNKNLERYADYSNRIDRGRSYVRHGAVLDLQITAGSVNALVQGSRSKPYDVHIRIASIAKKNWAGLIADCKGKLESLQTLIAGKFPKELTELFTRKGSGLFPSPKDITFDCSCPDWASMCKHVAAVLYGIGTRLDEDPNLFFVLRNVDSRDLLSTALAESRTDLLSRAEKTSSRILEPAADLSAMFGIDLGGANDVPLKKTPEQVPAKEKKNQRPKKQPPAKQAAIQPLSPNPGQTPDDMKIILALMARKKKGVPVAEIITKSGIDAPRVRNLLVRLKKLEKIESVDRGVYRVLR